MSQPPGFATSSGGPVSSADRPTRSRAGQLLERLARTLDRHPALPLLGLCLIYLFAVLAASHAKLLWHDELFTLYIAQAPSLAAMFEEIRSIDLNPPLSYVLTRASLHLFGVSTLACRLPEIVAFLVAMLALSSFVRRRAGTLYGILAASVLFSSLAGELAVEARPYALLLAFVCLALLGWQRAREAGSMRAAGLLLLPLSAAGMLLSHVFGVLPWAVFAAAELARALRRRHLDMVLAVLWIVPLVVCLTYLPMLRSHGASAFPSAFQPKAEDIFTFYISHVDRELVTVWLTAVAVLLLLGRRALRGQGNWSLTTTEWITTIGLLMLPALLIADLIHNRAAFFPRYGVVASIGVAVLTSTFIGWWTGHDRGAALLGSIVALLISGQIALATSGLRHFQPLHPFAAVEPVVPACRVCARTAALDPSLPLVDASGLTFLEMDHRESSADLDRVFYLTDTEAAMKYAHATIFEGMATEARIFPLRAHVANYTSFLHEHPHFFVFGRFDYPEDWLLRKLMADGANIRVRGRVAGPYRDHELYEVTAP